MSTCDRARSLLIEAFYEELDAEQRQQVRRHLEECQECAAADVRLRQTLELMSQRQRPELASVDWDHLASRLRSGASQAGMPRSSRATPGAGRLAAEARPSSGGWIWPGWIRQAVAAAALIAVGVVVGRYLSRSGPSELPAGPEAVRQVATAPEAQSVDVDAYIERAETLLVGVVNLDPAADGADALDLGPYRRVSERLLGEAPRLEEELNQQGDRRLAELVAELQSILRQIAELDARENLDAIEVIREGVDRQGLLFEIHVESARRSSREAASRPAGATRDETGAADAASL